jgi:peptide/nickel transport system permease protein
VGRKGTARAGGRHGSFARFVGRRVGAGILLVIGITLISFTLSHLVPGDPAVAALGEKASNDPAVVAAFKERYGLDKPLPQQYVTYLGDLATGDLGPSNQTGHSVSEDLRTAIPATIELALVGIVMTIVLGVGFGTLAGIYRGRWLDQVVRVVSLVGASAPSFWLALLAFYIFFFKLGWAPPGGRLDASTPAPPEVTGLYTVDALLAGQWSTFWEALAHIALPAFVLATYSVSFMVRFTRSAVLEVLGEDYILSAYAKGLPRRSITFGHVLRAAAPGVITLVGLSFATLLSGTVLVEQIFSWPGIGEYAYLSATSLDLNAVMGVSLFIAIVYVVLNFLVDLLYGVVDPRIRVT